MNAIASQLVAYFSFGLAISVLVLITWAVLKREGLLEQAWCCVLFLVRLLLWFWISRFSKVTNRNVAFSLSWNARAGYKRNGKC